MPASVLPTATPPPHNSVAALPGLSEADLVGLKRCGITTIPQLLVGTRTPAQIQQLAIQLQRRPQLVTKWAVLAELSQVPSVGLQYCGLLLHAGVGSIEQLAHMQASQLHRQLLRLQVTLLGRNDLCPAVAEVRQWIQQAMHLIQRR